MYVGNEINHRSIFVGEEVFFFLENLLKGRFPNTYFKYLV